MKAEPPRHSYATIGAIAALAFIVACVGHEAIGHGGMCLTIGGQVNLLTSVYFHCSKGGPLTDAAGPLMGLALGVLCWAILRQGLSLSPQWRLFLALAMAFNLFWGTGYFVLSAVSNNGDWAFVLRELAPEPIWLWRCLMGALGVYLYMRSIRLAAFYLPAGMTLVVSYFVAGAVSCGAALFFRGPTIAAVLESSRESLGAAWPLLLLAYGNRGRDDVASSTMIISRSNRWIVAAVLITLAFIATLGRGLGTSLVGSY